MPDVEVVRLVDMGGNGGRFAFHGGHMIDHVREAAVQILFGFGCIRVKFKRAKEAKVLWVLRAMHALLIPPPAVS